MPERVPGDVGPAPRRPPVPPARTPPLPRYGATTRARSRGPLGSSPVPPTGCPRPSASRPGRPRTPVARRREGNASPAALRQAQHALGDDVALDLVRARVDGAGQGEDVPLGPVGVSQLAVPAQEIEGGLGDADVVLGPEDLVQAGLGAKRLAPQEAG